MLNLGRHGPKYLLNVKIISWEFSRNGSSSKQLGEVGEIRDHGNPLFIQGHA